MEWFNNTLWLATADAVFRLDPDESLHKVNLGLENITCGWLHAKDGCMWSVGGNHLLLTNDGNIWQLKVVS